MTPSFPFPRVLSFQPLLDFWRALRVGGCQTGACLLLDLVEDLVAKHPFLAGPIPDPSVLATWQRDLAAAMPPFSFDAVYATPAFRAASDRIMAAKSASPEDPSTTLTRMAYRFILAQEYGIQQRSPDPPVYTIMEDGLPRHVMMQMDHVFLRVEAVGGRPDLPPAHASALRAGDLDLDLLQRLLPPDRFAFHGLVLLRATDITAQQTMSQLRQELLAHGHFLDHHRLAGVEKHVQALLRRADVRLSLAAAVDKDILFLNTTSDATQECICLGATRVPRTRLTGSCLERVMETGLPTVFGRADTALPGTGMEGMPPGLECALVLPLGTAQKPEGLVFLASPRAGSLDLGDAGALGEVLPLLTLAVRRSVDDLERRVQSVIQEKCTAVHPAVAWKFRRAATHHLSAGADGRDLEPVVFDDVFPLYAVSDIRGSSTFRNEAILADLRHQLGLAATVLHAARCHRPLPALDELLFRLGKTQRLLADGLDTGDEITASQFLRHEIEPLFGILAEAGQETVNAVAAYRAAIHPRHGCVYHKRAEFDDSVTRLNESICGLLEHLQPEAQAMFPHYFDKTSTDGVDQSVYVGPSLVEDRAFSPLYVRNLRLWQLVTLARIARLAHNLAPSLPLPLQTTHLVVVQDLPITIRFRTDEKRFAVDGAYNIRYEIMKKRMDKAVVRGTGERLTQPDRIAIVYSQGAEAQEYRRFLEFLHAERFLLPGVEELALENLQGIHGLQALRVAVDMDSAWGDARPLTEMARAVDRRG
jgi:hypothetical protein